jgi:ABC-type proline/glycine betaine transport system ATPase subunit
MDSDRILVLKDGQVEEFDSPHNLLQDQKSQLYSIVQEHRSKKEKDLDLAVIDDNEENNTEEEEDDKEKKKDN